MQQTGIQWTDVSANIIRYRDENGTDVWSCVKCSDGCKFCYSEKLALRFHRGELFTVQNMRKVTPYFCEKTAGQLLRSRKLAGNRVFIGDMTDVFGEWVPFDLIDRMFAVFALRPDVTFQILTKRAARMAEYLATDAHARSQGEAIKTGWITAGPAFCYRAWPWPLPNVWLGTSVEDQKRADERIPHLLRCPAAIRFLSAEPLLGPIDLTALGSSISTNYPFFDCLAGKESPGPFFRDARVHWVIVGGESGAGCRVCDVLWIKNIVEQCAIAGVPCFVKQLGAKPMLGDSSDPHGWPTENGPVNWETGTIQLKNLKGGDPSEWPEHLRVREMPTPAGTAVAS